MASRRPEGQLLYRRPAWAPQIQADLEHVVDAAHEFIPGAVVVLQPDALDRRRAFAELVRGDERVEGDEFHVRPLGFVQQIGADGGAAFVVGEAHRIVGHLVAQTGQTVGAGDVPVLVVGHGTVDAAHADDALGAHGLHRLEKGLGVAVDVQMRLGAQEDDQALLLVTHVVDLVGVPGQTLTVAVFELDLGAQKVVGARNLEEIEAVVVDFADLAGAEMVDHILRQLG
ncbi:MAG: hypothetical protein R2851_27230 [Caldilineaceae bacterium]